MCGPGLTAAPRWAEPISDPMQMNLRPDTTLQGFLIDLVLSHFNIRSEKAAHHDGNKEGEFFLTHRFVVAAQMQASNRLRGLHSHALCIFY